VPSSCARRMIEALKFYGNYHGHLTSHLETVHRHLQANSFPIIFLAGDSSLDNKHWLFPGSKKDPTELFDPSFTAPAPPHYRDILEPARSVKDVTFWLNNAPEQICAINAAVEASTLADRKSTLLPQDEFIRDNITENDTLIVSVGGNDVVLRPTPRTMWNMSTVLLSPDWMIEKGYAPGLGYLKKMFGDQVQSYVQQLISKRTPKNVLVCMVYYLDESPSTASWANKALSLLGYNSNPARLQMIIRKVFELGTCSIKIKDTNIIPIPLFHALDSKDPSDYAHRVEPSVQGGRKMADFFLKHILQSEGL